MDIQSMTAAELGKRIRSRELSAVEAADACLEQIEKTGVISLVMPKAPESRQRRSRRRWMQENLQDPLRECRWR